MNSAIAILMLAVCGSVLFVERQDGASALAVCAAVSLPTILILARRKATEDRAFLMRIFILGVLARVILATVIHQGHMEEFFGGDANTYSLFGASLAASWHGDKYHLAKYQSFVASGAGAWGMLYLVAIVYELVGENMFAIQLINASVGSATSIVVYASAQHIFKNRRVSRLACLLVCFWPSLVLWSAQALKDGLIVLVLALGILCTVKLMNKITVGYLIVLTGCLCALLTLRFYTFYMMVAAVAGSFLLGMKSLNAQAFVGRFLGIVAIGLVFTWFGVAQYAGAQLSRYGNLQMVQLSRQDMARSADSGFMKDVDVNTTEGALTAIPVGCLYLLFAPFPWQLASLRQSLPLPEMIVWWLSFPLLVLGLWYGVKHRLNEVAPIVIFTTLLTLAYSLVQGNVGTAYRQRSQLLVFYFIFLAAGIMIMKERAEDRRRESERAKRELAELQAARISAREGRKAAAG
jgi:Dolichyl-phosphate-mannose-protein mannosyltransferase